MFGSKPLFLNLAQRQLNASKNSLIFDSKIDNSPSPSHIKQDPSIRSAFRKMSDFILPKDRPSIAEFNNEEKIIRGEKTSFKLATAMAKSQNNLSVVSGGNKPTLTHNHSWQE